jgi:hypothetical protein
VGDAQDAASPNSSTESRIGYLLEWRSGTYNSTAQEDEEGLRRLLFAIIERAIRDAAGQAPSNQDGQNQRRSALTFIHYAGFEPFSFRWICDHLGLESGRVRRDVLIFLASCDSLALQPNCTGDLALNKYIRTSIEFEDSSAIHADVGDIE